jgi:hypothetical protein
MTEISPNSNLASLQAQLSAVIAALNMHMKRSEELAVEVESIQYEISEITPVIEA